MLTHLIITRFSVNTRMAGRWHKRDADDKYLRYRLWLFDRFCLPSITGQTSRNFQWFVLFGVDTPEWLRTQLAAYESANYFIPLYAPDTATAWKIIQQWIDQNTERGDQLLTTRLDSDDAFSCHFVQWVQGLCTEEMDLWYFCPRNGQQVVVRSNDPSEWKYFKLGYPANPFVSMLERITAEPVKMIYHRKHGSIKAKNVGAPVRAMLHHPMWMQILHGKNLGNGRWSKVQDEPCFHEFPFLEDYYKNGPSAVS